MAAVDAAGEVKLDTSDVDTWVGKPVVFAEMWDPCNATDIRRWVQALDYPNPVHWDEEFAGSSKFGGIVAPQSFTVAMDYGHGCHPACVGNIPGTHLIFAGEEWWFYGTAIRPGDKLTQERRFDGYSVTDTAFAGPTMFARGDTVHRNQHGTLIAKERATAIRYLVEEANKRGVYGKDKRSPKKWSKEELAGIHKLRHEWILSSREGRSPRFAEVQVGDKLPRRVIGPHSIASFTTEYRAFVFSIWGTMYWYAPAGIEDPWVNQDPGWVEGFGFDEELALIDPRARDGLYLGPSRGHIDADKAGEVGMARAYGYGATMAAWNTDYLAFWAGHDGMVRHAKSDFRGPAFEGDVTFIEGEVVEKIENSEWGVPLVRIKARMTNQDGTTVVTSVNEVELPY